MNWQDVPSTTSRFLRFYKRAIEAQPPNAGPMVVHCGQVLLNVILKTVCNVILLIL